MTVGIPTHYEQASPLGNTYDSMRDLWWFINGSHPTSNNTIPWECIECYDGTTREAPLGGNMGNLTMGNLWRPNVSPAGSLPEGAWAVFRNPGGASVAQFQVHVRMESSTRGNDSLITLDDWVIGAGTDASPTLPATIIGQPVGGDDGRDPFDNYPAHIWSVIVDEGMYLMRQFDPSGSITNLQWEYMGEVETVNSETDVPRPFVISRNVTTPGWNGSHSFTMLSPVDQSTILDLINSVTYGYPISTSIAGGWADLGPAYISSVACICTTNVGHRFTAGYCRNVGAFSEFLPDNRATCGVGPTDYQFEVWSRSTTEPSVVTRWPPGTPLGAGHTEVTELSIPTQLVPATSGGGGGDITPPEVVYVDPLPGSQITPTTTITVDVTDDTGGFANIQLRVRYESADPLIPTETIYGGDELGQFEPLYLSSTIAVISNGFRFALTRDGGWPSTPTFIASPIDGSGNTT